jgi:branched-chain amino acid transport system permease protein
MYFGMLTLAFGQLIFSLIFGWYSLTGGDNGLSVFPPDILLDPQNFYYLTLAIVSVCITLLAVITASPFGSALAAIRENPERAAFIGINVRAYQLSVFVIAGAFAGVAGSLRAPFQQMAFPSLLYWTQSAEPLLMSLIGGIHNFFGPVIGSAIFVFLNFVISSYTSYSILIFGVIVVLTVLFLPGGVLGYLSARLPGGSRRRPVDPAKIEAARSPEAGNA